MPAGIRIVYRVIVAICIEVEAINGFWIKVCCIIGRDKSAQFGRVITSIEIVEACILVVVVTSIANGVNLSQSLVCSFATNDTIALTILRFHYTYKCLFCQATKIQKNRLARRQTCRVVSVLVAYFFWCLLV